MKTSANVLNVVIAGGGLSIRRQISSFYSITQLATLVAQF